MNKRIAGQWSLLLSWKSLAVSVVFGTVAHLLMVGNFHLRIPGTQILTDPREIVVTLAAALSGPVGGIILGIFSGLYQIAPEVRIISIIAHILGAMTVGVLYKKWLYERLRMPTILLGWVVLVFLYYCVVVVSGTILAQILRPELYHRSELADLPIRQVLDRFVAAVLPELILTLVITSLILVALPSRFRRPLWGAPSPAPPQESMSISARGRLRRVVSGNFLGVRLGIWFFLLSLLPVLVIGVLVQKEVRTAFLTIQAMHRREQARALSRDIVRTGASGRQAAVRVFSHGRRDLYFLLDDRGYYVAHSDSSKIGSSAWRDYPEDKMVKFLSRRDSTTSDSDKGITFGYAAVPKQTLVAVVVSDPSFTEHTMQGLSWLAHDRIGIGFLIISFGAGIVIWLVVGRPIRKLTSAAEEIGRGNFNTEVNTAEMDDEIRVLGQTFNEMNANLRNAHRGLEEEIAERIAAGEALRHSKAQLSEVLRIARIGYLEIDLRSMEITLSDEAWASVDMLAEKLGGHRFPIKEFIARFIHPDDIPSVEKTLLKILNAPAGSSTWFQAEYRITPAGGETYWISNLMQLFRGEDGRPVRVLGSLQNISERKRAELESEASKRIFQAVVENNIDAIMLLDERGLIKYVSPSTQWMLGYSPDEPIGKDPLSIVHPDDQEKLMKALAPVMHESLAVMRTEYRARHKQGHWLWIEAVAKNLLSASDVKAIVVNFRDISDRRRAEQAVEAIERGTATATGEEFFKRLVLELSSALEVSCSFVGGFTSEDRDHVKTIAFANNGGISGNLEFDLRGTPCHEKSEEELWFFPDNLQASFPGFSLARTMDSQSCLGVSLVSSKGERLGVLAVMHTKPMKEQEFSISLVKIFAARAGAELERMRSEERTVMLAHAVESVSDCVTITDTEDRIIFVNNAFTRTYGYEESEVIGRPIELIRSASNDQDLVDSIRQCTMSGGWRGELWNRRKDGSDFPVELSTACIRDDHGTVVGLAGIATDITERKKSVEALLESEKRFREFADMLPQTVFEIDQQGRLTFTNRGAWSMFGYPREEVFEGRSILEAIAPPDHEKALNKMKSVMMGNPSQGGEYIMARKDGSTFPAIIYTAPFTKGGVAIGLRGIILDITERKRVEEAVHHERNLLRTLIDNLPESVLIYVKDCESRYVINNLAHLRSLGVTSQEDVLGKTSFDFFPPELAETYLTAEQAVIQTGQALVDREETVYNKALGRTRWHSTTTVPYRDAAGKVGGLVGMSSDITERKRTEEALRKSEEKFAKAFQASPILVVITQLSTGRLIEVNESFEKIMGYTREEALGHTSEELGLFVNPAERERLVPIMLADGRLRNEEILYRTKSGEVITCLYSAELIELDGEKYLLGAVENITERKWADQEIRRLNAELERRVQERTAQLEAANKELESFSYSVSHDLRAPLRHISGYIEILRDRTASLLDEESKRYLTTASEAAVRLGSLIDDLLTFSRIGRTELRKGNIDVRQLVNEVKQELEAEIRGRTIEWEIKSLPDVQADRLMLKLVLTNLMSNAVKFTRQRDHARIEIGSAPSSSSGENVYYVKDNGAGFDMKYSAKLFGVFQRLHTAEEFEGTGIGLANVKRIALLHGGTTWAESVVDGGATFYVSLPGKD